MAGPWDKYSQPQNVAPNPLFPGQMTAQQQQIQQNAATLPYAAPKAAADATNAAVQAQVNAATAPAEITQKGAAAAKAVVDAKAAQANLSTTGGADTTQSKNAGFYAQALRANKLYEGTGVNDLPLGHAFAQSVLPPAVVNKFTSPARQQAEAAQRDFIASTLRYESGAAIPESEFENQRQRYFPQPGDDPQTVAFKAKLRQNAIDALKVSGGPAATMLDKPAFVPAPTGPDAQLGSSQDGTSVSPDAASASFWEQAARKGTPYGVALRQWQGDVKARGLQVDAPPPPDAYNKVRAYIRNNPGVEYHPVNSVIQTPLSGMDKAANAVSSSAPGAALGHFANAAAATLPERLAGDQGAYFNAVSQQEHPVASTLGDIGGFTAGALGLNKAVGAAAPNLGRLGEFLTATPARQGLVSDMAFGGGTGAVQDQQNPLLGAVEGAGAMGAGNLAGQGLAKTLGSLVSPTGGKLAPLYEMGVRPSIGQRMGGFPNAMEEKLQSLPLVGDAVKGTRDRARDQFQVGLFNDALGDIGQQLPKDVKPGHAAHAFAQDAFDKAYNAAKSNMVAAADNPLAQDLGNLQRTIGTLKPDSQKTFNKIWSDSVARRFTGGQLSGPAFKDATSEIEKRIAAIRNSQSGDGELAGALQDAVDALKGSAMRNSPPEAAAAMDAADRGYAKLVRIEEASRKAGEPAEFSPTQYNTAVKTMSGGVRNRAYLRGDALNTDIAAIGTRLGDKVSNSGSFDRYAVPLAMTAASYLNPKAALALGSLGILNAPGIRGVTTGLMAPRGIKLRTLADLIRAQSDKAGQIGGATSLGLLSSQ